MVGFGIIGCGNIAPVHAESIQAVRGAKLLAIAGRRAKPTNAFANRFGCDAYTDYLALLKRGDLDAVCVCTPSGTRAEIAKACTQAGKHILSEKPLDITTRRIDRIIEAADKAGVLLGCILQNRFAEGPRQVRKALDQGRFGRLVLGDAYIKWYRSQAYYDSGEWRGTWKLDGGGALMNQGIHQIDLLLWFMGSARTVRAQTATVAHKGIEVEDIATVMIEFKNGAKGVIEGSTAVWPGHPARVEVHGTEGSAVLEDGKLGFWQFKKRKAVDRKIETMFNSDSELGSGAGDPLSSLKIEGHRRQIQDFVRAINQGQAPTVDGKEARRSVELIEKIYQSAKTGRAVHF